ncbi:hypothetical protein DFH09DRAFT_1441748 [Mycena vulgaris]|nr:hypothetical protein DFH09DRAFT_1441748 [Mycena vulgaris]
MKARKWKPEARRRRGRSKCALHKADALHKVDTLFNLAVQAEGAHAGVKETWARPRAARHSSERVPSPYRQISASQPSIAIGLQRVQEHTQESEAAHTHRPVGYSSARAPRRLIGGPGLGTRLGTRRTRRGWGVPPPPPPPSRPLDKTTVHPALCAIEPPLRMHTDRELRILALVPGRSCTERASSSVCQQTRSSALLGTSGCVQRGRTLEYEETAAVQELVGGSEICRQQRKRRASAPVTPAEEENVPSIGPSGSATARCKGSPLPRLLDLSPEIQHSPAPSTGRSRGRGRSLQKEAVTVSARLRPMIPPRRRGRPLYQGNRSLFTLSVCTRSACCAPVTFKTAPSSNRLDAAPRPRRCRASRGLQKEKRACGEGVPPNTEPRSSPSSYGAHLELIKAVERPDRGECAHGDQRIMQGAPPSSAHRCAASRARSAASREEGVDDCGAREGRSGCTRGELGRTEGETRRVGTREEASA